jgi:hypothetical protein
VTWPITQENELLVANTTPATTEVKIIIKKEEKKSGPKFFVENGLCGGVVLSNLSGT